MSAYSQETISAKTEANWKSFYYVGGAAPLVTLVFYLSELLFISWDNYPTSMEAWFALFQGSKLLGLFYLNALDIISVALLGVMFLALYVVLRKTHPAFMVRVCIPNCESTPPGVANGSSRCRLSHCWSIQGSVFPDAVSMKSHVWT